MIVSADEFRFWIKQIQLRRRADHVQINHMLRLASKVLQADEFLRHFAHAARSKAPAAPAAAPAAAVAKPAKA